MREQLDNLFAKEMDRKQFLVHLGAGAMAVLGISGLIKALSDSQKSGKGYGASAYGGARNSK
jgi:hypothetical protein